jgi:hypothetical protein
MQQNISDVLNLIQLSDIIRVNNSPYLNNWSIDQKTNSDNTVIGFTWSYDGLQWDVDITGEAIKEGHWDGDTFLVMDTEGEKCELKFYKLQPLNQTNLIQG